MSPFFRIFCERTGSFFHIYQLGVNNSGHDCNFLSSVEQEILKNVVSPKPKTFKSYSGEQVYSKYFFLGSTAKKLSYTGFNTIRYARKQNMSLHHNSNNGAKPSIIFYLHYLFMIWGEYYLVSTRTLPSLTRQYTILTKPQPIKH